MNRFDGLYSLITPGQPLWDIGCDHGLLGIKALREGLVPKAYFVDCARPPIERLIKVMPEDLKGRAHILLLKGEDLDWAQVSGTVVISGVGSNTITKILKNVPKALRDKFKLVLCAEKGHLVSFLRNEGWDPVQYIVSLGTRNRIITEVSTIVGHSL
jgi:tRNA A22 N-methylase